MKIQMLPTTFDENGSATQQQHLCCLVVDDLVAIDAGSLAMATTPAQKDSIRDVILTHAHLDHIAGLPLFIDDLFATLRSPICIRGTLEVIEALEEYIFNWTIYPRFSELRNDFGEVVAYHPFQPNQPFRVGNLLFTAIEVNHKVPTVGLIVTDGTAKLAISSDTAEMDVFWDKVNAEADLSALFIECAFPDELRELAHSSHHLTPRILGEELRKFQITNCPVFVTNIKPMYRQRVSEELAEMNIPNLQILEIGKIYQF
jgi:ribonuclease BN (tRNA processing enzyme)